MAEADALAISSRAMTLCSADNVIDFTDGTNEAQIASAFYESTLISTLTEHRWNFSILQAQASLLTAAPSSKWTRQYDLPALLLSLDNINPDHIDYELYARKKILTDYNGELWVEGQYRVDEQDMPPYFIEYFEYRLAAKFAFPVSGDKNLAAAMESASAVYKKNAKLADSKQRKGVKIRSNQFSLITARG